MSTPTNKGPAVAPSKQEALQKQVVRIIQAFIQGATQLMAHGVDGVGKAQAANIGQTAEQNEAIDDAHREKKAEINRINEMMEEKSEELLAAATQASQTKTEGYVEKDIEKEFADKGKVVDPNLSQKGTG
jgi:hypothetical protein